MIFSWTFFFFFSKEGDIIVKKKKKKKEKKKKKKRKEKKIRVPNLYKVLVSGITSQGEFGTGLN